MKPKYYLIIKPDEDGNPAAIIDEKRFQEILKERSDVLPLTLEEYLKKQNPNYWDEDDWFVTEIIPMRFKIVTTITKLAVVNEEDKECQ